MFGIEINEQISRAAKMNMIIHDDGHTNVITSDGLVPDQTIFERTANKGFTYGTFDFIITNPPFGSTIRQTEQAYLKTYQLGKKDEDWLAVKAQPETTRENQSTEVLFIEQDYKFLKPGGFLAIVIPDGILTNSSLQYLRNLIEDWFRIVAVVSMPQTAFSANGAGVKSSVMFLQKWTQKHTEELQGQKRAIEERLRTQYKYIETYKQWEREKKDAQNKKIVELKGKHRLSVTEIKKLPEYKDWNADLTKHYADLLEELQDQLRADYQDTKQKELPDYPILMAIADEIGYDATGRQIEQNDLKEIGEELKKFINSIIE